jgi:hypothetical protein
MVLFIAAGSARIPLRPDPGALVGTWEVDLRPTPDSEPYLQQFEVTAVSGDGFEGSFYGTPIEEGRLNVDWGALRFAFVTSDGSGPYNHSGVLDEGRMEGTTHSLGRDFLSYWTASRE